MEELLILADDREKVLESLPPCVVLTSQGEVILKVGDTCFNFLTDDGKFEIPAEVDVNSPIVQLFIQWLLNTGFLHKEEIT